MSIFFSLIILALGFYASMVLPRFVRHNRRTTTMFLIWVAAVALAAMVAFW